MVFLLQVLTNGVVTGSVYSLIAVGFALSFGVLRRVNFAHGVTCVVGGYAGFVVISQLGYYFWPGLFAAVIVGAALGGVIEHVAFLPFSKSPPLASVVTSLGCAVVIENTLALIFGENVRSFRTTSAHQLQFAHPAIAVTSVQVLIAGACVAVGLFLYLFLKHTELGRESMALSDDPEAAATWGVHGKRISSIVFMLSSTLAASAGYLAAFDLDVDPHMGTDALFKAFTANVIFGVGSLGGSAVGGVLLGIIENLVAAYISSRFKSASTFIILIALLLMRPRGILDLRTYRFR